MIAPYKMCVDFNACDGIAKIIWRDKYDLHRMFESHMTKGFGDIGTSAQINNNLDNQIMKFNDKKETKKDVSK